MYFNIMSYHKDRFKQWVAKIFCNNYVAIKKIGHGSYSSIWLAFDINK